MGVAMVTVGDMEWIRHAECGDKTSVGGSIGVEPFLMEIDAIGLVFKGLLHDSITLVVAVREELTGGKLQVQRVIGNPPRRQTEPTFGLRSVLTTGSEVCQCFCLLGESAENARVAGDFAFRLALVHVSEPTRPY